MMSQGDCIDTWKNRMFTRFFIPESSFYSSNMVWVACFLTVRDVHSAAKPDFVFQL